MELELQSKNRIIRSVLIGIIMILFSVWQNVPGSFPRIMGCAPFLLIPIAVCAGMSEGATPGIFFGLFAGALWDMTAAGASFNAIYLCLIGCACGSLVKVLMRNNPVTAVLLTAISTLVYCLVYWAFHYVVPGFDSSVAMLLRYYLPSFIYTIILTPFVFMIVMIIERKFTVEE